MAERPRVADVKLLDPPENVEEGPFWDRVLELRHEGMPWYNASRLARSEALGVRQKDGPPPRTHTGRPIRNADQERLDSEGNVIPNPMPELPAARSRSRSR